MGESKWEEVGKAIDVLKKYGLIDDDDFVCDCESCPNRPKKGGTMYGVCDSTSSVDRFVVNDGGRVGIRPTEDPEPEAKEYEMLVVYNGPNIEHDFDADCTVETYNERLCVFDADGKLIGQFPQPVSYRYI